MSNWERERGVGLITHSWWLQASSVESSLEETTPFHSFRSHGRRTTHEHHDFCCGVTAKVDAIKQIVKLAEDDESSGDGAKALSASAEAEAKSVSGTKIRNVGGLAFRSWCHGRDRLVASLFV